jgi:hypothetical protein
LMVDSMAAKAGLSDMACDFRLCVVENGYLLYS